MGEKRSGSRAASDGGGGSSEEERRIEDTYCDTSAIVSKVGTEVGT